jgi:hypothetical protein
VQCRQPRPQMSVGVPKIALHKTPLEHGPPKFLPAMTQPLDTNYGSARFINVPQTGTYECKRVVVCSRSSSLAPTYNVSSSTCSASLPRLYSSNPLGNGAYDHATTKEVGTSTVASITMWAACVASWQGVAHTNCRIQKSNKIVRICFLLPYFPPSRPECRQAPRCCPASAPDIVSLNPTPRLLVITHIPPLTLTCSVSAVPPAPRNMGLPPLCSGSVLFVACCGFHNAPSLQRWDCGRRSKCRLWELLCWSACG